MPTLQRRSKPVNGSVLAFAGSLVGEVVLVGVVVVLGVVLVAGLLSFDGEVPVVGVVGVWL